jgi:hypothetical protein
VKFEIVLGALLLSLSASPAAFAAKPANYVVTVHVQNDAPVDRWLLRSAQQETSHAFLQFGVDLRWLEPGTAPGGDGRSPEVSIVLMSAEMGARKSRIEQLPDKILARGSRRTGRAYVFCDRVSDVARQHALSEGVVLAHAFTHELGHMIANIGHDANGIMREALELRSAGFFGFTDAQQRAIRQALAEASAADAPRLALRLAPDPVR